MFKDIFKVATILYTDYTRNNYFIRKTIYCFALNNYICESEMRILTFIVQIFVDIPFVNNVHLQCIR
jgi:hypothetical protein